MSPAPTPTHQRLVLDVARQIADALEGHRCEVFIVPFDVRLPRGDEAGALVDTVVRPGVVIDWERVLRERPAAE